MSAETVHNTEAPLNEEPSSGEQASAPAQPTQRTAKDWATSPAGFLLIWIVILLGSLCSPWDRASLLVLWVGVLVAWGSVLLVAALVPPPAKLSETSALVARLVRFVQVVWATFVFTAGAVFGAIVGLAVASPQFAEASGVGLDYLRPMVWPIVQLPVSIFGLYTSLACAVDVRRTDPELRLRAVSRLRNRLPLGFGEWRGAFWLQNLVLACTRGHSLWAVSVLAPMILVGTVGSLLS